MTLTNDSDESSEDEVFIGKLTIKEIKKHIYMDRPRFNSTIFPNEHKLSLDTMTMTKHHDTKTPSTLHDELNQDTSLKIIESHSQPNLNGTSPFQNHNSSDSSFLQMGKFIKGADLREQLNNTFEFMDYAISHGLNHIEDNASINVAEEEKESFKTPEKHIGGVHRTVQYTISKNSRTENFNSIKDKNIASDNSVKKENHETSIKIIKSLLQPPYEKHRSSDASFIEVEKLVDKLCVYEKFNNTFEFVDYILKQEPSHKENKDEHSNVIVNTEEMIKVEEDMTKLLENYKDDTYGQDIKIESTVQLAIQNMPDMDKITSGTIKVQNAMNTPSAKKERQLIENDIFKTPSTNMKSKDTFETPISTPKSDKKILPSFKKNSQLNVPKYNNLMSSVDACVNLTPQSVKMGNINTRKVSALSTGCGGLAAKPSNKENLNFHHLGFQSAKQTQMIDMADIRHLPKTCQKKSSIPIYTGLQHTHKKITPKNKRPTLLDNSFENYSCQQAEVSVCLKKPALTLKK